VTEVLLDTNVLLSFLTDRSERQQALASDLIRQAFDGEIALVLHQIVVTEMVYVLRNLYKVDALDVALAVRELLALPGVFAVDEISWPAVLNLWPGEIEGFADAALAAVGRQRSCHSIATFDKPFTRHLKRLGMVPYWP
jgi:predicted nucleic acid-binding protein